jgi:hypothetical protein
LHDIRVGIERNGNLMLERREAMSALLQTSRDDFIQSNADYNAIVADIKQRFGVKIEDLKTYWSAVREHSNVSFIKFYLVSLTSTEFQ